MARCVSSHCSSSSTLSFNNATNLPRTSLLPSRPTAISESLTHPKTHLRLQFQLKSSNGYPPNAVSLQDGLAGNSASNDRFVETKTGQVPISQSENVESTLSITVVGASGDLAKKKIFPALFALYYEDWLPEHFQIFGYARSKMTDEELRNLISRTLTFELIKSLKMARCVSSHCSSSSTLSFNNATNLPRTSLLPSRPTAISESLTHPKTHLRLQFQLKSSNGYPPNAVFLQDGLAGNSASNDRFVETKTGQVPISQSENVESTLSITVVGASGDLAKKKIFPALFALYYEDWLPEHFQIFGYARSKMTDEELRNLISRTLTCRIDKSENCGDKMERFLQRCFYHSGLYDSEENFGELDQKLKEKEIGRQPNRLFYLSIPPNIFVDVVRCASRRASSENGWTRVIVEKPFGRDAQSSGELTRCLKQYLTEDQIFRIDHYLGKELVENLSVLRFSNLVFEPLWCRNYIRNVQLIFSEDFGTEGRGGYFDNYGIIRDIMQNHLLQILALFAMETPVTLDGEDIRNEKVKVLRSMRPVKLENVVVGQYKGHSKGGKSYPAYRDDPTVPKGSITPTFAAAALFIDNARWDGVPFLMKAGKALHTRRAEIRVQFRHVPGNLYSRNFGTDLDKATNELVLRVQPDEAIYLKINNKVPGLGMRLDRSDLNLLYKSRYPIEIPDAYERLLLDAIEGERRLFIRSDELDAAWALFTPVLRELEEKNISPELYPYGSRGPVGAHYLAANHNVRWGDLSGEDS
ncbi:hypothetical protein Scep_028961 [Stephania cephalantha]|uniref:Glucose-6-phosphate 1-dehydrogenase n=1 Tax=Stephania cephalantha TaxID=152367 RepID=A0AAP0HK41_9MAGN